MSPEPSFESNGEVEFRPYCGGIIEIQKHKPITMNRCELCLEELHTTRDGIEIDHAPTCSNNPLTKQIDIVYHNNGDQFYIRRHDNPANPLTPITLGAVLDLHRHLRRYAEDWLKEKSRL